MSESKESGDHRETGDASESGRQPEPEGAPVSESKSSETLAKTQADPLGRADFEAGLQSLARHPPALFELGEQVGGRYRIVRFLAEGGMGAVYEAEDEELGGRVALKAILPELGYRSTAVGRFRREILLSRKVTHPCVCRVFDVGKHVSESRGLEILFLTMELLSGETLSEKLKRDGAMTQDEALPIISKVASALQAAHDAGVIHRDLKASNVMLEPTGDGVRAVITDFGLSRSIFGEERGDLTQSGHMVGTPAYAAPEQIAGRPPTPACDIYSLGLVLYEMLVGWLPYADESPYMVAIQRLQGDPLPMPSDRGIEVHPRWEQAIQRCLSIEPERRFEQPLDLIAALDPEATLPERPRRLLPALQTSRTQGRRWGAIAAVPAIAILLLVAWVLTREPVPTVVQGVRVAVLSTEETEGEEMARVGSEVQIALVRALLGLEGVRPVDSGDVEGLEGGVTEIARATAADQVVVSRLEDRDSEWWITLQRVVGADGAVLWADDFAAPKNDARLLASALAARVRAGFSEYESRPGVGDLEVRPVDYDNYLHWYHIMETRPAGTNWEEVAQGLAAVRSGSPRFVEAYLTEARIVRFLYTQNRNPEYLEHAYQLNELAREMSPRDPRPLLGEIQVAYTESNLDRVASTIEELEKVHPGAVEVMQARAMLAERRGRIDEARNYLLEVVKRRSDWGSLMALVNLEVKAGDFDSARTHLAAILELSPGNLSALGKLAELELQYGSTSQAELLFSELLEQDDDHFLWTNLGISQLFQRNYGAAEKSFRQVLRVEPDDPVGRLNLADVLLLQGRDKEAQDLYLEVVEWTGATGADTGWGDALLRAQSLAHLGRGDDAVRCLQSDEVQNTKFPQVWFESSLVYALVGDRTSALLFVEKAISGGMNPRWFSLPWFDDIRPELDALLARTSSSSAGVGPS
ncbi:MAG: protein kinase [Thermoanaerobaculia bacterium]|nr:protein kinase [Thermoanaerobaculia bacterium]